MRIITGKYKGRHFDIPRTFKARPTTDFAKENIFNVINAYVISVEKDRDHARFISQCMEKLGTDEHILITGDVFRFLKSCHQKFDLIFADPPYALPELETIPDLIFQYDLLKEDGLLVFEHGKNNDFSAHPHFIEHRSYGSVNFTLFR